MSTVVLKKAKAVDTLGIEPSTPRRQQLKMLSGCDNQLHHVPIHLVRMQLKHISSNVCSVVAISVRWFT